VSARTILVTGATGGLGAALVDEALGRGHTVRATGRSVSAGTRLQALGADFISADLTHPQTDLHALLDGCDAVIHAAALSASWGPRAAFEASNVVLTRRLLDAARAAGVARFVFVSSPSIFADFADRIAIGEDALPSARPLNDYARTKLIAERLVLARDDGSFACCAVRPRALVGPGDRVILPKLAQLARRKRMPLPNGGNALIELTDLRDAAWAIGEAEARAPELSGRAINISGGRPVSVRDVATRLAAALGLHPRLVSLPIGIARPLAHLLETLASVRGSAEEPVLTRYTLATLAYSQTFDPEPARRLIGFAPRHDALDTLCAEARRLAREERPA
jgi:2-alkyl-3-oxoalkanoate reductase